MIKCNDETSSRSETLREGLLGALWLNVNPERLNFNANYHPDDDDNRSRGMALVSQDFMKTYKHLYERLYSRENLLLAFKKAKAGKSKKFYVWEFEKDLEINISLLQKELITESYHPQPLRTFVLRDPKTRKIAVSSFRDRVVHHAVCNLLIPLYEKIFIYDSYANRKGKGALKAIQRFDQFKRQVSQNGRLVKEAQNANQVRGYLLKADIKHYFENVNHNILLTFLRKKIRDEKLLALITLILNNFKTKTFYTGMPLGNLTSQFFANVYLNELDYFVKHRLSARYYLRYVDDFVIFHQNQEVLNDYREKIAFFLKNGLQLELHPQKCSIQPLKEGVDYLGYQSFYYYKLPRKRNLRKITSRLKDLTEGKETLTEQKLRSLAAGWHSYLHHANTFFLEQDFLVRIRQIVQHHNL